MFSARFSSSHEASPLWEALQACKAAGSEVFDLTSSNPTAAGIPYPESLSGLLARPAWLRYRPDPRGLPEAREAVAAYLNGLEAAPGRPRSVRADDLLLTASTSEAYAFLFKLLCDPGDEVLIPAPTYPLFDALAELEHVSLVRYPLRRRPDPPGAAASWRADLATLRNLVSTRTKALILVTPNNPTGHIAGHEEIAFCLDLAREHGLSLIVDEVFSEYVLADRAFQAAESDGPLVFTLNGLSKLAGLPQLKLGWIHVGGSRASVAAALERLEWIADAYLSVNAPVQEACAGLLALAPAIRAPIRARLLANLGHVRGGASAPGEGNRNVTPLLPEGGWSLVLAVASAADEEDFALSLLRERGVLVHPGRLFGFPEERGRFHLVASLLVPERDFREGYARLLAHAEAHAGG